MLLSAVDGHVLAVHRCAQAMAFVDVVCVIVHWATAALVVRITRRAIHRTAPGVVSVTLARVSAP